MSRARTNVCQVQAPEKADMDNPEVFNAALYHAGYAVFGAGVAVGLTNLASGYAFKANPVDIG